MQTVKNNFNFLFAFISVVVNTLVILWANAGEANWDIENYVIAHAIAAPVLAGVTMSKTQRWARIDSLGFSYLWAVGVVTLGATVLMFSMHYFIRATPDVKQTTEVVFVFNLVSSFGLVLIIRNKSIAKRFIIWSARKMIRFVEGL